MSTNPHFYKFSYISPDINHISVTSAFISVNTIRNP